MDNKQFNNMAKSDKRVAIAKDVIAALNTKKLIANRGRFMVSKTNLFSNQDIIDNVDVQPRFKKIDNCEVCAIGGVFVAAVDRFNEVKAQELVFSNQDNSAEITELEMSSRDYHITSIGYGNITSYLAKFFDLDQLRMLEMCFENGAGCEHPKSDLDRCCAAMYFHIKDPDVKMRAMMGNLIENNGQFVVPYSDHLVKFYFDVVENYEEEEDDEEEDSDEDDGEGYYD